MEQREQKIIDFIEKSSTISAKEILNNTNINITL